MAKVTGASNKRVSLAALIAVKPGCRPRLTYRAHASRLHGQDRRKGSTELTPHLTAGAVPGSLNPRPH
jgi:hypothetical protein